MNLHNLMDLTEEKQKKVTEKCSLCPRVRGKAEKGNREVFSVPENKWKSRKR